MKLLKKAQGLAIGNVGKIVIILLVMFVVLGIIFAPRFMKLKGETSSLTTNALLKCVDTKATPKQHLNLVMPYAARNTDTGVANPLYEPIESPKLAYDYYKDYYACRYKTKVFDLTKDVKIHKMITNCGKASLINLYLDYKTARDKATDKSEKRFYNNAMNDVKGLAVQVNYAGSLEDKKLADSCVFTQRLG